MIPIKITPEIVKAVEDADIKREKVNRTSTIDLVNEINSKIGKEIKEIAQKYGKNLKGEKLTDDELHIIKDYLNLLGKVIKQDMPMCKIFPQSEIKTILSLKKDLVGFFSREVDINYLLKGRDDYFNALYYGLRLDYNGSKFNEEDKYMGMLIVSMPNFSLRTPIMKELSDSESLWRKIYIENDPPYTGIGLIANEWCIPEFYISIADKSYDNKKEDYGSFPQEEFSASLKIIGHNNDIINFASYYAGDIECASDDKFVIYDEQKEIAKKN